jgi:urease accessory protein
LALRAERRDDGATILREQSFRAPFHLSKPYSDGSTLLVNVVNPTAGVLAGDELHTRIQVDAGASLLVTSPSATRVFRMPEGSASAVQSLSVGAGAWLEYLPEALVPHAGSVFHQTTVVDLDGAAELFYGDILVPGRLARGETWAWKGLVLDLTVRRGGELLLRERFDQSGKELRALAELSGAGEGACFCNLVVVSPRLESGEPWRSAIAALHRLECWVGVSALRGHGSWSIKLIARDSISLRHAVQTIRRELSTILPGLRTDFRRL